MIAARKRRRIFELYHTPSGWRLFEKRQPVWGPWYTRWWDKKDAVYVAADHCRRLHFEGWLVQLKVKNLDGRIAFERTYGKDPERSPG